MKKILLLLCAITLAACSDDDNGSSKKMVPTTITLAGDANSPFDKTIHITYDDKRRMHTLDLGSGLTYTFIYANDKEISEIHLGDGNNASITKVTYDSQGRISALGDDDSTVPVTYAADGSFSVYDTTFSYTNSHDISKYSTISFTYDNDKKGAFANVSAFEPLVMILIDQTSLFYATHKPVTALTSTDNSVGYSLQNTYDGKGYVTNSTLTGVYNATITYGYEDL